MAKTLEMAHKNGDQSSALRKTLPQTRPSNIEEPHTERETLAEN